MHIIGGVCLCPAGLIIIFAVPLCRVVAMQVLVSRERSRYVRKFLGGLNLDSSSGLSMAYRHIRTDPATGQQWRPPL